MTKPIAGLTYAERNRVLRGRGFASYKDYQDSLLWAGIRLSVLQFKKFKCVLCGGNANQVHHSRYSEANLFGTETAGLHAVCGTCHQTVEFDGDKKLTAAQSLRKFNKLLGNGKLKKTKKKRKGHNSAIGLAWKKFHIARRKENERARKKRERG